jgi:hypothetical protein
MTIAEIIKREGGPTAFAQKTGCPQRTAESWTSNAPSSRKPPIWFVPIFGYWLKHNGKK